MSTETPKSEIQREIEAHAERDGWTPEAKALLGAAALHQRIGDLERELSRVTEERDEMEARAIGLLFHTPEDTPCGEIRRWRDEAKAKLAALAATQNLAANQAVRLAKLATERDAALRRVEELEGLATGNECHADGGTWFEVFVSDDRLGGTETEGDECPTLGKVFPARLDAAEKEEKS